MSENTEMTVVENTSLVKNMQSFADLLMCDVTEKGYWASFPVETMEDKKALYAAKNDNEMLKNHMGEVIQLVGLVIDTQMINDPQVGARKVPCVHLIDVDGVAYQSASSGVVNSACDIMATFGLPETWGNEPLNVVCKETPTNSGYRYKYLAVV